MTTEVTIRIENTIYDQFMGFVRLNKQVEVVSENGRRIRAYSSGRPKMEGKIISKAFSYDGDSNRLMMLCHGLMALGWIEQDTDMQTFIELFSGGEIRRRVIWTGDMNILSEFFRRIVNERQFVKLPANHSLWLMVNGHFWEKVKRQEFGIDRLRKAHCPHKQDQTIAYMVDILDPRISLEEVCRTMERRR